MNTVVCVPPERSLVHDRSPVIACYSSSGVKNLQCFLMQCVPTQFSMKCVHNFLMKCVPKWDLVIEQEERREKLCLVCVEGQNTGMIFFVFISLFFLPP